MRFCKRVKITDASSAFTPREEQLIADAVIKFQANGTLLSSELVFEVAHTLVKTLHSQRRSTFGLIGSYPGRALLSGFLSRYYILRVQTTADLKHERSEAIFPERVVEHWVNIRTICEKYSIIEPTHVFNLDECGFSVKGMEFNLK